MKARTPPRAEPMSPARAAQRETAAMYNALAYVLAGPLTFGLLGWGVSTLTSLSAAVPVGIVGGMALSLYYVWFRYGTQ